MSKPMTRVVFSVLICLAIVAVMFTIVYAASARAGASGGRIPVNAGLTSIVGRDRQAAIETYNYTDIEKPGGMHDCESDSKFDPNG